MNDVSCIDQASTESVCDDIETCSNASSYISGASDNHLADSSSDKGDPEISEEDIFEDEFDDGVEEHCSFSELLQAIEDRAERIATRAWHQIHQTRNQANERNLSGDIVEPNTHNIIQEETMTPLHVYSRHCNLLLLLHLPRLR